MDSVGSPENEPNPISSPVYGDELKTDVGGRNLHAGVSVAHEQTTGKPDVGRHALALQTGQRFANCPQPPPDVCVISLRVSPGAAGLVEILAGDAFEVR